VVALLLLALGSVPPASAAAGTNVLVAGERLAPGQSLVSPNGALRLVMQTDGNLVMYEPNGRWRWQSSTVGNAGAFAIMQGDGNFVVYRADGVPLWDAFTAGAGRGGDRVVLQDDGNLVIYGPAGSTWATFTSWYPDQIAAGGTLVPGQNLQSPNGQYLLKMQTDGNLVMYRPDGQWMWHTNTAGQAVSGLSVQGDGNLVMYRPGGGWAWQSSTPNRTGVVLKVQDDGNVVFYGPGGAPIWHSFAATNIVKPGGGVSDVSGQVSAQQLLASGRLSGSAEPMAQIRAVANGTVVSHVFGGVARPCVLDPVLLRSLRQMVVDEGNSVVVSSFNRYCINQPSADPVGADSYHYRNGGGHAVDLGSINGAGDANQSAMIAFAQRWVNITATPAGIGQKQCRAPISLPQGVITFTDACNHLHLEYRG
jgi:hypothetical protein